LGVVIGQGKGWPALQYPLSQGQNGVAFGFTAAKLGLWGRKKTVKYMGSEGQAKQQSPRSEPRRASGAIG